MGGEPDEGAASAEYGVIVFGIAAMVAAIIFALGQVPAEMYGDSCTALAAEVSSSAC